MSGGTGGGGGGHPPPGQGMTLSLQPTTPGGPIQVTWEWWSLVAPDAAVTVTFFFQGVKMYSAPPVQSSSQKHGTGAKSLTIYRQDLLLNAGDTKALYTIGQQGIDMEVRAKDGTLLGTAANWLDVSADPFADWWRWDSPLASQDWRSVFTMSGHFHNITDARQTYEPIGIEVDLSVGGKWVSQGSVNASTFMGKAVSLPTAVDSGESSPVLSWTNVVGWDWLNKADWSITGPTSVTMSWVVATLAVDEFGNVSLLPFSDRLRLGIDVSGTKTIAATIAHNEFLLAAGLSWLNVIAAAIAVLIEAYWGKIALDPPPPDPAYRKAVVVTRPKLRALPANDPTLAAIGRFFRLGADIAAGHTALSMTEGRLLGARRARNRAAVNLQVRTYRKILRSMHRAANRIPDTMRAVVAAGGQDPRLSMARHKRALAAWRRSRGVPADIRAMWRKARLPRRALQRLDAAVRSSVGKEIGKESVVDTFSRVGTLTALTVVLAGRRAPAVLAGGQAVEVGRPDIRRILKAPGTAVPGRR